MARYVDADKLQYSRVRIVHPDGTVGGYHAVVMSAEIKDAPAADVEEVKHGEWILHTDGCGTCNQCRRTQKNVWDDDNWQNFCGCCGAKMDGGKAE